MSGAAAVSSRCEHVENHKVPQMKPLQEPWRTWMSARMLAHSNRHGYVIGHNSKHGIRMGVEPYEPKSVSDG